MATVRLSPAQEELLIGAGLTLVTGGLASGALVPTLIQTLARFDSLRQRFPRLIGGGQILRTVVNLQKRGLTPRLGLDPFTGGVLISTADQAQHLQELTRNAAIKRLAIDQDTSQIFEAREALIRGLRETAVERGFASRIDPALRGGVFRPTADAPLQFIEGVFT